MQQPLGDASLVLFESLICRTATEERRGPGCDTRCLEYCITKPLRFWLGAGAAPGDHGEPRAQAAPDDQADGSGELQIVCGSSVCWALPQGAWRRAAGTWHQCAAPLCALCARQSWLTTAAPHASTPVHKPGGRAPHTAELFGRGGAQRQRQVERHRRDAVRFRAARKAGARAMQHAVRHLALLGADGQSTRRGQAEHSTCSMCGSAAAKPGAD